MHCGVLTVNMEALLTDAMDLIVKYHVTGLPVVDSKMTLLGIITENDILLHLCKSKVIDNSFHRVPIVHHGILQGIISRADVLKYRCSVFRR